MKEVFIRMIVIVVCVTVGILLQILLAKCKNKWLGLLLPGLFVILSVIYIIGMVYTSDLSMGRKLIGIASTFVELNIPTLAFYVIYKVYHKSKKSIK